MIEPLPKSLSGSKNRMVLKFLRSLSAHSDIVEPLSKAVHDLPGAECYSPDYSQYRYVVAYVGSRVFAFAEGMHGLTLRLPPEAASEASTAGARLAQLGGSWWFFELFEQTDASKRIDRWIARAHAYALQD
jgi:hypothetical protein